MEQVFLSYTYRPHPDHAETLDLLRRNAIRVIEAFGLRVVDGVDVGGRPLDQALQQRIEQADAFVALMTPQADDAGSIVEPLFVLSEFAHANALRKPSLRVLHEALAARGLGAGNEYAPYRPSREIDVVMKLMATLAVWKRETGRLARVRIEPERLAGGYDEARGDTCEYQRITAEGSFERFIPARVRLDPGALYAEMPMLRDDDRVRLRMRVDGRTWQARHAINPFVGGVQLEELA